ncbi:CsbD family protein [Streptacidiphilus jiangxiensis]|uniref:CsbD-like n=1 Tax=Streptacidiphilus jiangxiensis TaxID=235985 RepID=A0A1H7NSX0_STRJI|nr:CsbD family protein [Streptacidiphilus jiangxiensis]SEL26496.1 CsbD-like [Streptacidiphilus jiangxiensis]
MSISKKAAHKAEAVKGGAKKAVGRATGDRALEAEGRGDQIKGDAKQAGAKVKDAFKH